MNPVVSSPSDESRSEESIPACPPEGQGVNDWTFYGAIACRQLGLTSREAEEFLLRATKRTDPIRATTEIQRSIEKIYSDAPRASTSNRPHGRPPNQRRIEETIAKGFKVQDLRSLSPCEKSVSASLALDVMFPGDPLLCLSVNRFSGAKVRRKSQWLTKPLSRFSFIVPSPMTAVQGLNQQGRHSDRCLDNTGPRRFFVVEIDPQTWEKASAKTPGGVGTPEEYYCRMKDEQAGVLWELEDYAPLAVVVDSGKKSLHGYYYVEGWKDSDMEDFFNFATSLGADKALWLRCQLARLPGGTRDTGEHQRIEYLDPGYEGQNL